MLNENNNILCIKKNLISYHQKQILSTTTFDLLDQIDLVVKGYPVYYRVFSSTLGLQTYQMPAATLPVVTTKMFPDVSKCPLDVISPLIENY